MGKAKPNSAPAKPLAKSRAYASENTSLRISAEEFKAWQAGLELSNADAARLLFVSPNTITAARADGAGPDLALKCRAVSVGIAADDDWQFIADTAVLLKAFRETRH